MVGNVHRRKDPSTSGLVGPTRIWTMGSGSAGLGRVHGRNQVYSMTWTLLFLQYHTGPSLGAIAILSAAACSLRRGLWRPFKVQTVSPGKVRT